MVSTRHHPKAFPGEPASPTSSSRRSPATPMSVTSSKQTRDSPPPPSTRRATSRKRKSLPAPKTEEEEIEKITTEAIKQAEETTTSALATIPPAEPATTRSQTRARSPRSKSSTGTKSPSSRATRSTSSGSYSHSPSPILIPWLLLSLPLVLWDTSYILLRPHSMPGGKLHYPFWAPYGMYGTVDYMYGFPAWESKTGFTAAQGSLNAIETAFYIYYLAIITRRVTSGDGFVRGVALKSLNLLARRDSHGRNKLVVKGGSDVATAVVVLFAGLVMTWSKTVLYWLNEYFAGFTSIGHNDLGMMTLWIILNGAWIIVPVFLTWQLGIDIVEGLAGRR